MSAPQGTLGKYQIIREIARSNDIVFEAYDPLMNRRVAIKELAIPNGTTASGKEDRVKRFQREARAAGTLAHPNIMTVYELAEDGDRHYIAMEFLDGKTLRQELDSKGALSQNDALRIATEVLKGLSFAHAQGVIHRDIKPDNIQLLSDGRVKITDFGIARLTFEPNLTMDGQVFGTPSYMSPEQVNGKEIDVRSDLFSLGVVLYEMIAGEKPFKGDSVVAITYAIMNNTPDQPSGCNWAIWQVINKALEKAPMLRPASADEMILMLEQAVQMPATSNGPTASVPNVPAYYSGAPTFSPPPANIPPVISPQGAFQAYDPYAGGYVHPSTGQMASYSYPDPAQFASAQVPNYQPFNPPAPYYAPPRQPVFSSQTSANIKRVLLWLILMATVIIVLVMLISVLSGAVKSTATYEKDQQYADQVKSENQTGSVDDQIQSLEQASNKVTTPRVKIDLSTQLAQLYATKGQVDFANRDYQRAESNFTRASELDPSTETYRAQLGMIYQTVAQSVKDNADQALLWAKSADSWKEALVLAQSSSNRGTIANQTVIAEYQSAKLLGSSDSFHARMRLEEAKQIGIQNPKIAADVDLLLHQLESR